MKKFALWSFYVTLGLFLAFVIGGVALPDNAHVERQTVINAPPEKIFAIVSDLQNNKDWSPWMGLDPQMKLTVEGQPGVGQKVSWASSNPEIGVGTQTVTVFEAPRKVAAKLDFGEMGQAVATIILEPATAGTLTKWQFDAALNTIFERWFGLMFDRVVGPDFEKGLAALKAHAEKP